jgi:hypothetical protein
MKEYSIETITSVNNLLDKYIQTLTYGGNIGYNFGNFVLRKGNVYVFISNMYKPKIWSEHYDKDKTIKYNAVSIFDKELFNKLKLLTEVENGNNN